MYHIYQGRIQELSRGGGSDNFWIDNLRIKHKHSNFMFLNFYYNMLYGRVVITSLTPWDPPLTYTDTLNGGRISGGVGGRMQFFSPFKC